MWPSSLRGGPVTCISRTDEGEQPRTSARDHLIVLAAGAASRHSEWVLQRPRVDLAHVFLVVRIVGACGVAAVWVLLVFVVWIAGGMTELDAEPGDSTTAAMVGLAAMVTAFAVGALMLLVRPRPLRTPYAIFALLLMILGAAPIVVLLAA